MALYVVTGGCGFIGSHVVEALLARGDRVRILDNLSSGKTANVPAGTEIVVGDVADTTLVRETLADADGCFHLAAVASVQKSVEDWLGTNQSNLVGTIAVLDAARREGNPLPVVYASSAAVYGDNETMPLGEEAKTMPLSAYGADKLACELHGRIGWLSHRVPAVGFRFFNVYGPRQDPNSPYSGVIAIFAERMSSGQPIRIFGDGEQVRDFVYVRDVVRYLLAAMARPDLAGQVFNVCTGRPTSVKTLAATIGKIVNYPPQIEWEPPRNGDIRVSIGDPSRAKQAFGFTADTLLQDGLRPTLGLGE